MSFKRDVVEIVSDDSDDSVNPSNKHMNGDSATAAALAPELPRPPINDSALQMVL